VKTRGARKPARIVGIAIPAVLALLAAVTMLMLAYGALAMANWLAARNLREGVQAWATAESATAAVVEELREAHRRLGALPDTYDFDAAAAIGVSVDYTKTGSATAAIDVLATGRHVAARRVAELDMAR
jgi:uncharacterized protein YbjQ (UPF0145 family)